MARSHGVEVGPWELVDDLFGPGPGQVKPHNVLEARQGEENQGPSKKAEPDVPGGEEGQIPGNTGRQNQGGVGQEGKGGLAHEEGSDDPPGKGVDDGQGIGGQGVPLGKVRAPSARQPSCRTSSF